MAAALRALIDHASEPGITGPPSTLHKDTRGIKPTPSQYELDHLTPSGHYATKAKTSLVAPTSNGLETPSLLNAPGINAKPIEGSHTAVDVVQSLTNPPMNRWRFLASCLMCFANGLNDSAPGALIPYIEPYYNIGYAVVSMVFVANAVGFICAALYTTTLQARYGRAKVLVFAESLITAGYTIIACAPPFPVVVIAFLLTGLGMATNLALNNVFVANLANATGMLGVFHGSYGIGGTIGPLIATGLVTNGVRWSTFYLIPLGMAVFNLVLAFWSFRNYEKDLPQPLLSTLERANSREQSRPADATSKPKLTESLRNKTTLLGALFIFVYQGAEVSISGWVISFLLTYRSPAASSRASIGYVTAGFFGGITLGRFLLSHSCHKVGEKISVFVLVAGATAFQLLVWFVPNIIGEAVAVALVGLLLGPIYPCITVVFSQLIGRRLQMTSLAFISAMGSSGGALLPFLTGLISQSSGTWVLHPICVSAFALMAVCWASLDRIEKRSE
ncbi:hypothetical protein MMC13_000944 [Lambiella insularis]|nr:hypothetical protein [Lambiella insularis]